MGEQRGHGWVACGEREFDKTVKVWNVETGSSCTPSRGILMVTAWPDGSRVVSGEFDKTVKVWNGDGELCTLEGHSDPVMSVAMDGSRW